MLLLNKLMYRKLECGPMPNVMTALPRWRPLFNVANFV